MSRKAVAGLVLLAVLAIAYLACSTYAIVKAFTYDQTVSQERRRNTVNACVAQTRQNDGIIAYLRRLGADGDDIQQARAFFPNLTRAECEQMAAEQISKP